MTWDTEDIFTDGDAYFQALLGAIAQAQESVLLESYIFERDVVGRRVLAALGEAAQRGLKVKLLLDGLGCFQWIYPSKAELRAMGIELKFYHPLPWQLPLLSALGLSSPRKFLRRLGQLNKRNHRKLCVIDTYTAFVGGMNVSDHHLRQGQIYWQDCAVKVQGRQVELLARAVELAWSPHSSEVIYPHPNIRLNFQHRWRKRLHRELIERIHKAQRRVWLTTPYFAPDPFFLAALCSRAREVDVRLLVSVQNDVWYMKWLGRASFSALLAAGVKIHEYTPAFLHAKRWIIDDWATVGSSNLNHRSFFHDLEVDVVLEQKNSIQKLTEQFQMDLSFSFVLNPKGWAKRPWAQRALELFFSLFRRWS